MLRILALGLLALTLGACAQPASVGEMATGNLNLAAPAASPLKNNICVGAVTGGSETNPLWVSKVDNAAFSGALGASLLANDLAAAEGACGYDLDARLNTLEQPLIGVSMTVTAGVDYALRRTGDAAPLFQTSVTQPYTAEFNSAFIGAVRLRIANEGAIRTNIETMLRELSASDAAEPSEAPTADGDPTS